MSWEKKMISNRSESTILQKMAGKKKEVTERVMEEDS